MFARRNPIKKIPLEVEDAKKYCLAFRNKMYLTANDLAASKLAGKQAHNFYDGTYETPACNDPKVTEALIVNKDRNIPGKYSGWSPETTDQTFYGNVGNMIHGGKKLRRKTYKKSHRKSSKKQRKSRRARKSRRGRR